MPKFTRKKENFTCEHCGAKVLGNGYTNHCPKCLWSKHVDINPGDRQHACGGMMRPIAVEINHGAYILIHRCEKCGIKKQNKTSAEDDFQIILTVAKNPQF